VLATVTRSGVTESVHDGAIAVVDPSGRLVASHGDIDRRYFARSTIKPFQATVVIEHGAELPPEWLALACSSHTGAPIHISTIRAMLRSAGLSETHLLTPPGWPDREANRDRLLRTSHQGPESVFNNCSGKHVGFLMACVASGWDLASYREPTHPLQERVQALLGDVTGLSRFDVGVDGCGAPTYTVSARSLATAFARLGNDERFSRVFDAMHRFPRLSSGMGKPDAEFAIHTNGVSKRGAEGNLGLSIRGRGAMAIKVFDGESRAIGPVVTDVLTQLGWVTPAIAGALAAVTRVPMSGGGREVGTVQSVVRLDLK
jgi:L-asparaginase II